MGGYCGWVRVWGGVREDEGGQAGRHERPQKMLHWSKGLAHFCLERVLAEGGSCSRCKQQSRVVKLDVSVCLCVCEVFAQAHMAFIWVGQASGGCEEDEEDEDRGREGRVREGRRDGREGRQLHPSSLTALDREDKGIVMMHEGLIEPFMKQICHVYNPFKRPGPSHSLFPSSLLPFLPPQLLPLPVSPSCPWRPPSIWPWRQSSTRPGSCAKEDSRRKAWTFWRTILM